MLDDPLEGAVLPADDPAVPRGVVDDGRQDGDRAGRSGAHLRVHQGLHALGGEQGHVAVGHDHPLGVPEGRRRHLQRVTGAQLGLLEDELQVHPGEFAARGGLDLGRPVPHHHHDAVGGQPLGRAEHPAEHGPPAEFMETLGGLALHARALACGEDHDGGSGGHRGPLGAGKAGRWTHCEGRSRGPHGNPGRGRRAVWPHDAGQGRCVKAHSVQSETSPRQVPPDRVRPWPPPSR